MNPLADLEHLEILGGNTKPLKSSQVSQNLHWCFTWNNYCKEDIETLETLFKHLCHKFAFQEETGDHGTPHLQGVISLKKRARWTEFGLPKCIHWEKCAMVTASYLYCTKIDTRSGGVFTLNFDVPEPVRFISNLYPWQKSVVEMLKLPPDDRTVFWYWSAKGNMGKSAFCKYLVGNHSAVPAVSGKYADICNLVFNQDMTKCKIICFDIPRNNGNHVSYSAIESIKNGMIVNTKYETGFKLFNAPHVIVFSNEPPDLSALSEDRWHIINIDAS